jgi:hypothetical protein
VFVQNIPLSSVLNFLRDRTMTTSMRGYFPPADRIADDDDLAMNDVNNVGERMITGLSTAIGVPDMNYMFQALRALKEKKGIERLQPEIRTAYSIRPYQPVFINLQTSKSNSPLVYGQGIGGNTLNARRRTAVFANFEDFDIYCEASASSGKSRESIIQLVGYSIGGSEIGERESETPKEFTYTATGNMTIRWNSDKLLYAGEYACYKLPRRRRSGIGTIASARGPLTCEYEPLKQIALDVNKTHIKTIIRNTPEFSDITHHDLELGKCGDYETEWAVSQKYATLMNAFQIISELSDRGVLTINGPNSMANGTGEKATDYTADGKLDLSALLTQFADKLTTIKYPQQNDAFKPGSQKLFLASILGLITPSVGLGEDSEKIKRSNISQEVYEKSLENFELIGEVPAYQSMKHAEDQIRKTVPVITECGYTSNGMMLQNAISRIAFKALTDAIPGGTVEAHIMTDAPPASKYM